MNNEEKKLNVKERIQTEGMHSKELFHRSIFEPTRRKRGHIKFIVLLMLQEQPMHGYALMKAIEEKYEWPPSQGIIYPTLQMLEDLGYVEMKEQDHKKVYSITNGGKQFLQENKDVIERIQSRLEGPRWSSIPEIGKQFNNLAWLIFSNHKYIDENKVTQIEEILEDARRRIGGVIFGK